jgi:hypothetical protein
MPLRTKRSEPRGVTDGQRAGQQRPGAENWVGKQRPRLVRNSMPVILVEGFTYHVPNESSRDPARGSSPKRDRFILTHTSAVSEDVRPLGVLSTW